MTAAAEIRISRDRNKQNVSGFFSFLTAETDVFFFFFSLIISHPAVQAPFSNGVNSVLIAASEVTKVLQDSKDTIPGQCSIGLLV